MGSTSKTVGLDVAAGIMGISKEALRKRIQRGTIEAEKDSAGRWQVRLPESDKTDSQDSRTDSKDNGQDMSGRLAAMQDEIIFLRKELERKDQLMAMLMNRVPQIEAPRKTSFFDRFKRSKDT